MHLRMVVVLAAVLATVLAPPAVARADEEARQKYKDALKLHDDGKCDQALPMFRDVVERLRSPNARLYVGRCLHQLGQLVEAYGALSETVQEATERAKTEPRYAQTRDAALAERGIVTAKIGLLTITAPDAPAGLVVSLDADVVAPQRLGEPIPVLPGQHIIAATAVGYERFRTRAALGVGSTARVAVQLKPSQQAGGEEPAPIETTPTNGGEVRVAGYVVAGLGVAGWAVFAITGLMAQDKYDTTYETCGGQRCADQAQSDEISTGRTLETVANVGLVTGIVGVLAGTAMIVFGGPSDAAPGEATASWTVEASPNGGRLRVRF